MDSRTILRVLSGSAGTALGERVGRLERGYRADVVVLDVRSVRNLPVIDPVDAVVNYLEGDCVTDVVVGGRLLVEGGELKTIDEGELLEKLLDKEDEVREKIAELRRNIGARPPI
jgi:guanine deaminase